MNPPTRPHADDPNRGGSGAPPDWLDALLHAQAAHARPADEGFSARVMAALPAARAPLVTQRDARRAVWLRIAATAAAGLCAAALVALAPPALTLLASIPHPADWVRPGVLEGLLPPLALGIWLCWWSVRQAQGAG